MSTEQTEDTLVRRLCEHYRWDYPSDRTTDFEDYDQALSTVRWFTEQFTELGWKPHTSMNMEELLGKQEQLMEKVPHAVTTSTELLMLDAIGAITDMIVLLGAHGHKPWRPKPLSDEQRSDMLAKLKSSADEYMSRAEYFPSIVQEPRDTAQTRVLISVLGVIEEVIEYFDAAYLHLTTDADNKGNQLEEITDILFFYLELVAMSGFTLDQIEKEYKRKHAVNLERYRRAKEGDFRWDKRSEGTL